MIARSPDEFLEEVQDRLLAEGLTDDLIRVDLSASRPLTATINCLEIRNPANWRKGLGRRALNLLMQLADESGFALEVIPHSFDGPMSDECLAAWYERNGFQPAGTVDTPNRKWREPKI